LATFCRRAWASPLGYGRACLSIGGITFRSPIGAVPLTAA